MVKRGYGQLGGASHARQAKVHLTELDYHRITNNMHHIYDKTLDILFRGANPKNNNSIESTKIQQLPTEATKKSSMKQTFFKADGSLETGPIEMIVSPTPLCSSCSIQPSEMHLRCGYCESGKCTNCAIFCSVCSAPTCNNCSINGYNNLPGVFCLSCCR